MRQFFVFFLLPQIRMIKKDFYKTFNLLKSVKSVAKNKIFSFEKVDLN
ncbi:hypothetical protein NU08_4246 [Flavobacterium anhuiense]|uniref:Uncharacterized protein n=1 Tax=Flavobacterium anhuiense TaxID=459526 RepID=A0A444VSX2_9FLAO|nr:hypothetical protein NU08_4246 [Flavobacterium anhuiense]